MNSPHINTHLTFLIPHSIFQQQCPQYFRRLAGHPINDLTSAISLSLPWLFWFKQSTIARATVPRGVIPVAACSLVKGTEDVLIHHFAFDLSFSNDTMFFIADSEKEKEGLIDTIGRSTFQHSRFVTDSEVMDYDSIISGYGKQQSQVQAKLDED